MQARYGQGLPFPLCFVLPRIQQFHVRQTLKHTTPKQVSRLALLLKLLSMHPYKQAVQLRMHVTSQSHCIQHCSPRQPVAGSNMVPGDGAASPSPVQISQFRVQIYESLEAAYAALAERLNGSDGDYIFGTQPSSLDALLYGHLAFHQAGPVSGPEIQHQVSSTNQMQC